MSEEINKNLIVYKKMKEHIIKDLNNLNAIYKNDIPPNIKSKIILKSRNLQELNEKIINIENQISIMQNSEDIIEESEVNPEIIENDGIELEETEPVEEILEQKRIFIMDDKIEQLNRVDLKLDEEKNKKKDILNNMELLRLKKEKENQVILIRKQEDMKKELEKQKIKKELLNNQRSIHTNQKILDKSMFVDNDKEADELKQEIEKNIYIEIRKKEIELKNYQTKLQTEENDKINNVITQVRQENQLQFDKHEQLFKKRDDKIRQALDHLNNIGSQLNNLSRSKNPNNLKFAIHKTLDDHKQCVDILMSLIKGETGRFRPQ